MTAGFGVAARVPPEEIRDVDDQGRQRIPCLSPDSSLRTTFWVREAHIEGKRLNYFKVSGRTEPRPPILRALPLGNDSLPSSSADTALSQPAHRVPYVLDTVDGV